MKWQKLSLLVLGFALVGTSGARADQAVPIEDLFESRAEVLACSQCVGFYTTSPGGNQASHWGLGSSCTAAANDLSTQLFIAANDDCESRGFLMGACNQQVVVLGSCWWSTQYQKYVRDGYINYGCKTFGPECQD